MAKSREPDRRLRAVAESKVRESKVRESNPKAGETDKVLYELEVHRIELELQNEELRESRSQLEIALADRNELFDFGPIGYAVIGDDSSIREINHAGARLLDRARSQLVGQPFLDYVAIQHRPAFQALLARAVGTQQSVTCELAVYLPEGERAVRATCAQLARPEPTILLAFEDISQHKAAEHALREADRRKDEFLATLSHELRNPLAPIRTGVYLLQHVERASELANNALAVIERQVAHMTRLIEDLLDVTRIARGKIALKRETFDLRELIRRVIEDHTAGFNAEGIRVERELAAQPLWVNADAARIIQVASNVLGNAQKFMPAGGTVTITLAERGGCAVLRVRDTGIGIAPELTARVFDAFTQAPQTLERPRGGLGLGLAMAKGIVELHDGTIAVTSEGPGRGTEVTIALPLAAAPHAESTTPAPTVKQRRRVLVIEDSADMADLLKSALELQGHEVEVAHDGPEGIARAHAFHPDVVLCDLGLPGMDGLEVARTMRADHELHDVLLVALSGYARPEDRARTTEAGFDLHVAKPADVATLTRIISDEHSPRSAHS